MEENQFILGLDLGVGSVGWACMLLNETKQPCQILDLGSRIFDPEGASMEERRIARGTRRVLRRKKARVIRTKNLFNKFNYLTKEEIIKVYQTKGRILPNPYQLRLKGKEIKLSYEELLIILVHYVKGRGFKSNRKALEENTKEIKGATEEQKLLFAKQKMEQELQKRQESDANFTFTNLLIEKAKQIGKIRNTSGEYTFGVTRKMVEDELKIILNKQVDFQLISFEFMQEYLDILMHQRLFSEGPDTGPYHDPLKKMIGKCSFTKDPRSPKAAMTYELFTLVQKLQNIRYTIGDNKEKQRLEKDQILSLIEKAKDKKTITYKLVKQAVGIENIRFSGLMLSRDEYFKIVENLKSDPTKDLKKEVEKAKENNKIYKMENYSNLSNMIKKQLGSDYDLTEQQYDLIADCLTKNKSDVEIQNYLNGDREVLKNIFLPEEVKESIILLEDKGFKAFGKVSLSFLYRILPLMINENKDYYEACLAEGYDHTKKFTNAKEEDYVPAINKILIDLDKTINNRSVVRTLVEARKIVNAVIRKYGKPVAIHIEMARELTKSANEKKQYIAEQQGNEILNSSLRFKIYSQHSEKFRSISAVTGMDMIQYKLFLDQRGICPYTLAMTGDENLAKINERDLFTLNVEVDHIIPYATCFDDRYVNKVLVKKQQNQQKRNLIPMQYLNGKPGISKYMTWIKSNYAITAEKKERLLAEKVDEQFLNDYRARTINDTRYATKAFKEILEFSFPSVKIRTFTGQITAKLRGVWKLNGFTHSMEAADHKKKTERSEGLEEAYQKLSDVYVENSSRKTKEYRVALENVRKVQKEDQLKNRENHLHHALDAVVIACATEKVRRDVELHEMIIRQAKQESIEVMIPLEVDEQTGEVLKFEKELISFEEYKQRTLLQNPKGRFEFPLPYTHFEHDVEFRVYEMNCDVLRSELSCYPNYEGVDMNTINPLFVSHHYSSKLSGRLHKATFYGMKETEKGKILTGRIAINSEKFKMETLEKLFDKDGTQSYIYSAVKNWMQGYKDGGEAYKSQQMLPLNKNGNPIKKVKLNEGLLKEEIQIQKNIKQYVSKEDVVQVHIYQRKDDDKLYFVGMDRFRLMNSEAREDLDLFLWWGQEKNHIIVKRSELKRNGFIFEPLKLMKGQTILVEKNDGRKGLCKVVGFTGGKLEVGSILGDGYDLINSGLFLNHIDRYKLTVSSIKNIKPISVDVLGKIHSNV